MIAAGPPGAGQPGRLRWPILRCCASVAIGLSLSSIVSACAREPGTEPTVVVAVAANFVEPHAELASRYEERTGVEIVVSVASTGQLYAQIVNGAPFDLLLAADSERPRRLVEEDGLGVEGSRFTYATGRLALYGPGLDSVRADGADLTEGLLVVALANPRTAPYGVAAHEVIERLGLSQLEGRTVQGESIGQTYQYVRSGAAELGFVALSQVIDESSSSYWLVPERDHSPILQEAVLLERARDNPGARSYLEYLRSEEARALIESYGYGGAP